MVRLRVLEILKEQGRSKYWLHKRMGGISYQNFNSMVENKTSSVKYENLDLMSDLLNCSVGDLFEKTNAPMH